MLHNRLHQRTTESFIWKMNPHSINNELERSKSKHYWNDSCHGDGDSELLNILGMAGKKWWWDEYKEGKNRLNGNEKMQQPEAGLMRPILAGYLCDDDREGKKTKSGHIWGVHFRMPVCNCICTMLKTEIAPVRHYCRRLLPPAVKCSPHSPNRSQTQHFILCLSLEWHSVWGFCTCLKVIRAPFHTWRGPPRWGGMLKQMQQPLKTDSPDLLMLLLCAHTQM